MNASYLKISVSRGYLSHGSCNLGFAFIWLLAAKLPANGGERARASSAGVRLITLANAINSRQIQGKTAPNPTSGANFDVVDYVR
jgi:hypothetical protein